MSRSSNPWLWGGDPTRYFTAAGLRGRPVDGSPGRWRLQTEERYRGTRPDLITVDHLAGPAVRQPRFELIDAAVRRSDIPDCGDELAAGLEPRRRRAARTPALVDAVALWQAQTVAAPPTELGRCTEAVHRALTELGAEADPDRKPFADAGVHFVRRAVEVLYRAKLTAVLLQAEHDPRFTTGIGDLHGVLTAGGTPFAASQGLHEGIFALDAYLGSLTPTLRGSPRTATSASSSTASGQPIAGTAGGPTELLQVLPSRAPADRRRSRHSPLRQPGRHWTGGPAG